jgi:hypothetical protein
MVIGEAAPDFVFEPAAQCLLLLLPFGLCRLNQRSKGSEEGGRIHAYLYIRREDK